MRLRALPIAFIAACGGDLATPDGCADHTWSCAEVEAAVAAAYGDATISCVDGAETFTISSDGVPLYTSNQTTPNDITAQNYAIEIPMTATCASSAEDITDSRGPTAIAITGIVLFGPADALGRDAIEYEGPTMDDCWGHAAPAGSTTTTASPSVRLGRTPIPLRTAPATATRRCWRSRTTASGSTRSTTATPAARISTRAAVTSTMCAAITIT